jgi:hypothetical protein
MGNVEEEDEEGVGVHEVERMGEADVEVAPDRGMEVGEGEGEEAAHEQLQMSTTRGEECHWSLLGGR